MKTNIIILLLLLPYFGVCQFFRTHNALKPKVQMITETSIGSTSAYLYGYVLTGYGLEVKERGFVYSTSVNPDILDNKIISDSGLGQFDEPIIDLTPNTTYYVNAYAITSAGIAYGVSESFTTLSINNTPTVVTSNITSITSNTAVSGGNVTDNGGSTVTSRGICWNTLGAPTINDNKTTDGSGLGTFVSNLTNLEPGKTYYVKAYATNSTGTGYGEDIMFTTNSELPTVYTNTAFGIETNYAFVSGNVTNDGGSNVTERGIVYGTSPNPTTGTPGGTGLGSFTVQLSYLNTNTEYFYRAYAKNINGTNYGLEYSFITDNNIPVPPTVTTSNIIETWLIDAPIKYYALQFGGNVVSTGSAEVTERGYVASFTDNTPTISEPTVTKHTVGSGLGQYSESTRIITAGNTYYIRAFATNSAGTSYGETKTIVAKKRPAYYVFKKYLGYTIVINNVSTEFYTSNTLAMQACHDTNNPNGRAVYQIVANTFYYINSQVGSNIYHGESNSIDTLIDGYYMFNEPSPTSDRIVRIQDGIITSSTNCN